MKPLNQPSIAFIDYISYRQLIDRRLIVDIPYVYVYVYVTLDHKNSHKGTFYEIEIYSTSWINKLSIDVCVCVCVCLYIYIYIYYIKAVKLVEKQKKFFLLKY